MPATTTLAAGDLAGNPAGASSHRLSALKSHVKALNEAFADWIQIQRDANAFGAWSSACEEYVKYLGDLQREYSDVLPNGVGAGDLDAAGAPGTRRTEVCLFGTGDCGQLGFGEDVLEQSIPKQLSVSGLPVSAKCFAKRLRPTNQSAPFVVGRGPATNATAHNAIAPLRSSTSSAAGCTRSRSQAMGACGLGA